MSESELIERAQKGDKKAYVELIQLHHRPTKKSTFQGGVYINDILDVAQYRSVIFARELTDML